MIYFLLSVNQCKKANNTKVNWKKILILSVNNYVKNISLTLILNDDNLNTRINKKYQLDGIHVIFQYPNALHSLLKMFFF